MRKMLRLGDGHPERDRRITELAEKHQATLNRVDTVVAEAHRAEQIVTRQPRQ